MTEKTTMNNRRNKKRTCKTPVKEFVTVAFAEDMELAKQYKKLLNEDEIPVAIKAPTAAESSEHLPGIAVMVPEDNLDEAHLLIESQGSYGDFYEMVFHENENEDMDDGFYDDENEF